MSLKILDKGLLKHKVQVAPGDRVILEYDDNGRRRRVFESGFLTKSATYTHGVVFELEDELGFKDGLGGAFCREEDDDDPN